MPAPFLTALLLGAGFMGFVAWDQSHWWRTKEDYGFGYGYPSVKRFVRRVKQALPRWPMSWSTHRARRPK